MRYINKPILLGMLTLGLVACGNDTVVDAPAATKDATAVRSPGKTGAPVAIRFEPPAKANTGELLAVPLSVTPTAPVDEMTVRLRAGDGILLEMPQTEFVKQADTVSGKRMEALQQAVKARPTAEGLHYISVFVETRRGNRTMSRVTMIPVRVGDAPIVLKPEGEKQIGTDGEPVISLPAEERRSGGG